MERKKEFKEFVKKNEYVYQLVKDKKYSWQELYEFYDIYGEEADVFKQQKEENRPVTIWYEVETPFTETIS